MSFCQRYTVLNLQKSAFKCLFSCLIKTQHSLSSVSKLQRRNIFPCCMHHRYKNETPLHEKMLARRRVTYSVTSGVRNMNCDTKLPCSVLRKTTNMCLLKSYMQFMRYLVFKKFMSTDMSSFTLRNPVLNDYVNSLVEEYDGLTGLVETSTDKKNQRRLMELSPIVEITRALKTRYNEMEELRNLQTDPEMKCLAEEDMKACTEEIESLESELVNLLMVGEKEDEFDIILEVTPGVGGQEAMLFALEIFNMYAGYAAYKGWEFLEVDRKPAEFGGVLSASATVSGQGVYREMKFESGVHRVQRVPVTEVKGRIHTSTMTVAILPQPSEIDVEINMKDVKVDVCRASGKGGQHVNVTDSAVRITHLPTGMVVECQQDRSQTKNKATAMKILRTRLYEKEYEVQLSKQKTQRKLQVGSRGRSEKIRTYNFPQDRITDHRLKNNYHHIEMFIAGGQKLESMISELIAESKRENLQISLDEFEESRKLKQKQQER